MTICTQVKCCWCSMAGCRAAFTVALYNHSFAFVSGNCKGCSAPCHAAPAPLCHSTNMLYCVCVSIGNLEQASCPCQTQSDVFPQLETTSAHSMQVLGRRNLTLSCRFCKTIVHVGFWNSPSTQMFDKTLSIHRWVSFMRQWAQMQSCWCSMPG